MPITASDSELAERNEARMLKKVVSLVQDYFENIGHFQRLKAESEQMGIQQAQSLQAAVGSKEKEAEMLRAELNRLKADCY